MSLHPESTETSSLTQTILHRFKKLKWGSWSLVCLYLSLISGIIVGLQYDVSEPYYSVSSIDLLIPFGEFFRSLHFYSSQAFFLLGCVHLVAVYEEAGKYSTRDWVILIFSLVVALLLLFTGYVLRADNTGFSAGMIAEAILNTIPVVGSTFNTLLFDISERGMHRVYVHHMISLDILWLVLAWDHLRRYRVRVADHTVPICLTLIFCLFIAAPLEPEKLGITYIAGPWFFLGLQELLRYFHPLFAGVIFPLVFVVALLYARKQNRWYRSLLWFLYGWLVVYFGLSLVAWVR